MARMSLKCVRARAERTPAHQLCPSPALSTVGLGAASVRARTGHGRTPRGEPGEHAKGHMVDRVPLCANRAVRARGHRGPRPSDPGRKMNGIDHVVPRNIDEMIHDHSEKAPRNGRMIHDHSEKVPRNRHCFLVIIRCRGRSDQGPVGPATTSTPRFRRGRVAHAQCLVSVTPLQRSPGSPRDILHA